MVVRGVSLVLKRVIVLPHCPQTQKATGRVVAIKKIAMKLGKYTEGANFTALREIKLLQELKHEHIIEVRVCVCVFLRVHPSACSTTSVRADSLP